MKVDRRLWIGGAAALAAGAAALLPRRRAVAGELSGADASRGHRLRDGRFPPVSAFEEAQVVIAGGGASGLAAGWTLAEAGFGDFRLLELEDEVGGNARSGRNAVSAYPLGAHYLPVANREAKALRHLLARLGMIVGEKGGVPVYDPFQLCADLQERLLWQGKWQEGLVPRSGLAAKDRADISAFFAEMSRFAQRVGSDGRPAFALPIAYSSRDADLLALDRIGFAAWLDGKGWRSRVLRGHLRYCMRDDYGAEPEAVSAWAGIHYFAGRRGWAADGAADNVLTWPEGNGRLVGLMARGFPDRIASGRIVHRVSRDGEALLVDSFDTKTERTVRTRATAVILALPHFVAQRIAPGEVRPSRAASYAPWLVANVTVDRMPAGKGEALAWDNVSATSNSLGYVVATHQGPAAVNAGTVLTWYMPLSDMTPGAGRRLLLERPAEEWKRIVAEDLIATNPELDGAIRRIDLWRWGHAMIRPTPDYIWGDAPASATTRPPLFLAHSDLSGLSLFEEAHYQGTRAAEAAMRHLGHAHESLL
jgi:hypothetical protein